MTSTKNIGSICYLLVLTLALLSGCAQPNSSSTQPDQVLLVGIDGAEWQIIMPLMHMGYMPVMSRFRKTGISDHLYSPTMSSPTEWTSIVTGKQEKKHGIFALTKLTPGTKKQDLVITRKQ